MQPENESAVTQTVISPNATAQRRSAVVSSDLNDETVLLDLESGIYFGLNQVGASIWRLIETPRTVEQIQEELGKEYDIDRDSCSAAVQQFLAQLAAKNLITLIEK